MPNGNILLVDDEFMWRELFAMALAADGHTVASASSGAEALALLEQRPFDVVLLDLLMPGMSGLEVLQQARARALASSPEFIVLSGSENPESKAACRELGVTRFLPKPIDRGTLSSQLEEALRQRAE